jgi:hypothetical protein
VEQLRFVPILLQKSAKVVLDPAVPRRPVSVANAHDIIAGTTFSFPSLIAPAMMGEASTE